MLDKSKDYKVDVSECDEAERKALQEHLFKRGYKWYLGVQVVTELNRNFLFIYADGDITSSDSRSYFIESDHTAITVLDIIRKETVKDVSGILAITLRDYFAGCALSGLVASPLSLKDSIKYSFEIADYMLKYRQENK